jgi:hypothetical protein
MRRAWTLVFLLSFACGEDPVENPGDSGLGSTDGGVSSGGDAGMTNNDLTCRPGLNAAGACGGDLLGTWTYRNACSEGSAFAELGAMCAGLEVSNEARSTSGTLTVMATSYDVNVSTLVTGNITVPSTCAVMVGGCAGVETLIEGSGSETMATCTGIAACDCEVQARIRRTESGSWSASGGIVTTLNTVSTARDHFYCVEGGVLRYREVPQNAADDEVSYTLER